MALDFSPLVRGLRRAGVCFSGATLNVPEHVALTSPPPGNWLILVNGFDVASLQDKFELRVALNGKVVK